MTRPRGTTSGLPRPVTIVYRRLPDYLREFAGMLLSVTRSRLVIESRINPSRPVKCRDLIIADKGYLGIWFVFKGRWYDIGKFYDRSGKWLGYYFDIIKPVRRLFDGPSRTALMTDLFLDLWLSSEGESFILDRDELADALRRNHISPGLAKRAEKEMGLLVNRVRRGILPPRYVKDFQPSGLV